MCTEARAALGRSLKAPWMHRDDINAAADDENSKKCEKATAPVFSMDKTGWMIGSYRQTAGNREIRPNCPWH